MMNLQDLTKYDNFYGCFVLSGDTFLMEKAVQFIKQKMHIVNSLDCSIFDMENFSIKALIESCEQVSFFTTNRLVIIKNITDILESDKTKLENYVSKINPMCTLLILDYFGKFDFLKVTKLNFTLSDFEFIEQVKQLANQKEKIILPQNITYLSLLVGKDLTRINIELDKLSLFCKDNEIKKQDIDAVVTKTEDVIVFELTSALGRKDANNSLNILYNLIHQQYKPTSLLQLMANNFTRLFTISTNKNVSDEVLAQKFGIKPFAVKKLRAQLKNFTAPKLKNIVYEFCDVEYMIKSGLMQQDTALVYIVEFILNI